MTVWYLNVLKEENKMPTILYIHSKENISSKNQNMKEVVATFTDNLPGLPE